IPSSHAIAGPPGRAVVLTGRPAYCTPSPGWTQEGLTMLADNIFLKIINKEIAAKIVHEDDLCVAFHDVAPRAPVHFLIIPRKVITTPDDVTPEGREVLGHLAPVAARLAKQLGLADGYRLVVNCRERAGQTVPHLHMHLLGGRDFGWPPG